MKRCIAGLLLALVSLMIVQLNRNTVPHVRAAGLGRAGAMARAAVDCSQQDITNIPTADCNALVALYNSTNGPGWTYQTRWMQAPVCGMFGQQPWYGVGCDCSTAWSPYKCKVVSVWLQGVGLSGTVPPEFAGLSSLRTLVLKNNQLAGSNLDWLPSLTSLQSATLDGNGIGGSIPTGVGSLASLKTLSIANNALTGAIPTQLGGLAQLQTLALNNNQLAGAVPVELGGLAQLQTLALGSNQFTGTIPVELGGLAQLQTLTLGSNQLTGTIPTQLANLALLKTLDASSNQLTGPIPLELSDLVNLEELLLANNQLDGDLPAFGAAASGFSGKGAASKLRVVDVSYNKLTGIKLTWGTGTPLRSVSLRGNQIKQALPAVLFQIPTLEFMDLGENKLEGQIPDVAALANLKILKLDHNNLTGGIPLNIDLLQNLEVLNLSYNLLDRTLDLPLTSTLPKLYHLDVSHNALYGAVPTQVGLLTALKVLRLNDNQLSGTIPSQMANLVSLEELDLSRDKFTGGFPQWIGSLTNLKTLSMRDIEPYPFGGQLPQGFGGLINLQHLDLNGLGIEGPLPSGMANMTALTYLDLGYNHFTGNVPDGFSQLTKLQVLDMSLSPQLDGFPLANLVNMTQLRYCDLGSGPVTAGQSIPAAIGDLKQLQVLDLDNSGITGALPARLGELNALTFLDLGGNPLEGAIPGELGGLSALKTLWLPWTHLTSAPAALGGLSNLEDLDLSHNATLVIPEASWMGGLLKLKTLNLAGSPQVGGGLAWLGSLTSLQSADMEGCGFTGTLPGLTSLANLKTLNLAGNKLTALPAKIGPAGLETLDLSGNNLGGAIPADLALAGLKSLHLDYNHLTGGLPAAVCSLSLLEQLTVDHNTGLTGELLRCLMNLSHMQLLQFYYTDLCEWGDPAFQWFLARTDPGFVLRPRNRLCPRNPVSAQVGLTGASLTSEGDGTTYTFPPGTFGASSAGRTATGIVTVTHTPLDSAPSTGSLAGIRHFYSVTALDEGGQPIQPVIPYTVVITYGPADLAAGHVITSTLALYGWDGAAWVLEPTSLLDLAAHTVTANPSHISTWAVLGQPLPGGFLYLPLVRR